MDKRIGAQYFTIRDYIKTIEDFDASCKKISDIGYKIVQISGCPLEAKPMREVLDKYGLKNVVNHRGFPDFEKDIDEIIEYNKTLGCDICGVGMMPVEYGDDLAALRDFINKANKITEELKKENMYFGYHNHSFEFKKLDGKPIMEYLMEETDPEAFNFIIDTYWLQAGGVNPPEYIEKVGKRAMIVHFKDFGINPDKWVENEMYEIGNGNLDWDSIIKACENAGVRYAVVEQDRTRRDPFESLKISYDFLTKKGFC